MRLDFREGERKKVGVGVGGSRFGVGLEFCLSLLKMILQIRLVTSDRVFS